MHRLPLSIAIAIALAASISSDAAGQGSRRRPVTGLVTRALDVPSGDTAAWNAFNRAIDSSKTYIFENVRALMPLIADPTDSITGVTLTADTAATQTNTYGIWITGVPELQTLCQRAGADSLADFLRRLMGLTPTHSVAFTQVIRARASDVFRPAPNELLNATVPCSLTPAGTVPRDCGKSWPDTTNADYRWLVSEQSFSYQPYTSYPFTDLGYTYNWNTGADRYGVSEYVIRARAGLRIVSTMPTEKYCTP